MGDDRSAAAALAIMRNWSWQRWDLRDGGLVSDWRSLNDAVNALAFDGHADPAGAFLQLLIDGTLIARGSYHWRACRNGDRFSQQTDGIISANRWRSLRDGLGKRDWATGGGITLDWLDITDARPGNWGWSKNEISFAQKSGDDFLSNSYSEEWFSAWNITVYCPPADFGSLESDTSSPVKDEDCQPDKSAAATTGRSRGRPPRYDWEGALAHVVAIANTPDGLETGLGAQAEIERLIADYFAQAGDDGDTPCESEIRKRASRVIKAIEAHKPSLSKVA